MPSQPVMETPARELAGPGDLREFLAVLRQGGLAYPKARSLFRVSVLGELGSLLQAGDKAVMRRALVESTDTWTKNVACLAFREMSKGSDVPFLKQRFDAEGDPSVRIQLLFCILKLDPLIDFHPFEVFIRANADLYISQNTEYSEGTWKQHSFSRLQDPAYDGNRRLYLLNLELLGVREDMLRLDHVRRTYRTTGGERRGIEDLSFSVKKGEFVTVFGPNGCGKTTLLRLIAGLENPESGRITSEYGDPASIPKCYVWQNYGDSLLPWRSIEENIAFPLKLKGVRKTERRDRARYMMERFGVELDPHARVYRLSGGEQQMVSILRGLILEPDIMLLDEPFSALDYQRNLQMMEMIERIWQEIRITTIFVSHDLDAAIYLADRLVLLSKGPCHLVQEFANLLPRPRKLHMMSAAEHMAIKESVLDWLGQAVLPR